MVNITTLVEKLSLSQVNDIEHDEMKTIRHCQTDDRGGSCDAGQSRWLTRDCFMSNVQCTYVDVLFFNN